MSRFAYALLLLPLLAPAAARANGRFPQTVNVRTRPDNDQHILLPVTFGVLSSNDDGASFQWMCEAAVGYSGTFDPDYAITPTGRRFATTFEGLRVTDDGGCTWSSVAGPLVDAWVGEVEVGPDGRVWAATSSGGAPNDVYLSEDGGVTFVARNLYEEAGWWKSLRVAPSDGDRVYVTGYLVADSPQAMLRRSDDGGQSWVALPVDDFTFGSQPQLFVEAVSPTDPDVVFARVLGALSPTGDAIYRSTDAGASWTKVLEMGDVIGAFVVRSDGATVIAGTVGPCLDDPADANKGCVRISTDGGVTWSPAAQEPKMACLGERSDGVLFACGANWEPDNFALGRSTDGQTWTKIFRFSEMTGPVGCPAGSDQAETCVPMWDAIADQFGVNRPDAGPRPPGDAGAGDGGVGDAEGSSGGNGCGCSAALAAIFFVLPTGRRRRRR